MSMSLLDPVLVVAAYLVGSLSSAILVSRAAGLSDPRESGSGNPGATNMLRHAGRRAAAIVLVSDFVKGLVPTIAAAWLGSGAGVTALTALAACSGHVWPVYFGFRGGKAVATYAGASFGLSPAVGATFLIAWLGMVGLTRISSVGALTACALAPLAAFALAEPRPTLLATIALSALVVVRHRRNIRNLVDGTEGRLTR